MDSIERVIDIKSFYEERDERLDFIVCHPKIYLQIIKQCNHRYNDHFELALQPQITMVCGVPIRNINQPF
jgi:hypothetical protein